MGKIIAVKELSTYRHAVTQSVFSLGYKKMIAFGVDSLNNRADPKQSATMREYG